jgi:hypothetical protein
VNAPDVGKGAVCHASPVTRHAPRSLRSLNPKERETNLFARPSTGKVGYVWQVKRALGYRILPEDDEVDKLARKQLDGSPS